MPSLELQMDTGVINKMLSWVGGIEEYEKHHAVDGLFLARGFAGGPLSDDDTSLFYVALNFSYWTWIDDRSDRHLIEETSPVNWTRLISYCEAQEEFDLEDTPEEVFFRRLCDSLRRLGDEQDNYRWWLKTAARVFRGMWLEELAAKGTHKFTYSEYLESGAASTSLTNILAAVSLVYGLRRSSEFFCLEYSNIERFFSIQQRLLNDIMSCEKERKEGVNSQPSNAVLLLEPFLGSDRAVSFIRNELSGVDHLLAEEMNRIGQHDPFVRIVRRAKDNINAWYSAKPQRYRITDTP